MLDLEGFKSQINGSVLITGHTGFKGTWLTLLLEELGINCTGVSLPPAENSLYLRANRKNKIPELFVDINDFTGIQSAINKLQPSIVIHLAAQSLVSTSYADPLGTFETNVLGTANVLEAATSMNTVRVIACVTTDKVYLNSNSGRKFLETDPLGGIDPYSASKVGTESVIEAWRNLAKTRNNSSIISLRAGNVIGGGDYAENRLLPDITRHVFQNHPLEIRNFEASRPWQHVLDPLIGYLMSIQYTLNNTDYHHKTFNFGPKEDSLTVREVLQVAQRLLPGINFPNSQAQEFYEANSLQLDSQLAESILKWTPKYSQESAIASTIAWWENNLVKKIPANFLCQEEIREFLSQ